MTDNPTSEQLTPAPVRVQPVVRPRSNANHPWRRYDINQQKLKGARKEAKRIYERKHYAESELRQMQVKKTARRKRGLPDLDASPKMKPWDHVKGRVV